MAVNGFEGTPARRPTLGDVAALAGVTSMTASRVLNGSTKVKPETRDRVRRAMRALNYVPNRVAGVLATRTSRLMPVVVPSLTNAVFIDVIRGAQEVIEAAGYQILLGNLEYAIEKEAGTVAALLAWSPDAFILSGTEHSEATHDLLRSVTIPVVEIMDLTSTPIDINIGFSHEGAGRDMGRYLLGRGYRSLVFAGVELDHDRRAMKRYAGFRSTLVEAGLAEPPVVRLAGGFGARSGAEGMQVLLDTFQHLDCIYFSNDDLAVGALMMCQQRGIAVPEQVAIAGFNGLEIGQIVRPRITTTLSPRLDIGRLAAESALRRIAGETLETSVIDVGCRIIPGESA